MDPYIFSPWYLCTFVKTSNTLLNFPIVCAEFILINFLQMHFYIQSVIIQEKSQY